MIFYQNRDHALKQSLHSQTSHSKCKKHNISILMCISTANAKIAHDNEVNQCEHASCEDRSKGVLLTTELSLTQFWWFFMIATKTLKMNYYFKILTETCNSQLLCIMYVRSFAVSPLIIAQNTQKSDGFIEIVRVKARIKSSQ